MSPDLIEAIRQAPRSERLWSVWYTKTYPGVYYAAYRFSRGNADAARDLTQETFTRFVQYDAIQRVDDEEHARAFLIKTCRNLAIDRDARAREIPLDDIPEYHLAQPSDTPAGAGPDLEEMLQFLDTEDRKLIAWTQEGFTLAEIARKLNISYTAAGVRLHRLRKRLRQKNGTPP